MRILLVEADMRAADPLIENLRLYGHDVRHVRTGADALDHPPVELVLADLELPDLDGLEVCRLIRQASDVPIIVLSALSAEGDRVLALHVGADDYLIRPFGLRELIARMEAVSRRYRRHTGPAGNGQAEPVRRHGAVQVDLRQRQVTVSGRPVRLTRKEFDLLALLLEDPGAVVERDVIIDRVWDSNWFGSTRTVDAHISALRRKLHGAVVIETMRGVGFRLEPTSGTGLSQRL